LASIGGGAESVCGENDEGFANGQEANARRAKRSVTVEIGVEIRRTR
jgi:hypothetical protein